MKNLSTIFFTSLLILGITPWFVCADEIRLDAKKVEVNTGEQFFVDVVVGSNTSLNAVEGIISYPKDILSVTDIRDGNSVINFWVEKPKDNNGQINFSGATPVGFRGTSEKIFTILFTPIKGGEANISFQDAAAYINDGMGNKAQITPVNTKINIRENFMAKSEKVIDIEQPEDFTPILVKNININDGNISLLFATQDKGIGMDSFYIKEGKYNFYREATSPYQIIDKNLIKDIYIKAVDKSGNERIVIVPAKNKPTILNILFELKYLIIILLVLIGSFRVLWIKLKK